MQVRAACPEDAAAFQAIYGPIVRDTAISFEATPPTVDDGQKSLQLPVDPRPPA